MKRIDPKFLKLDGNVKLFKQDAKGQPIHEYRNDLYPFMQYTSVTTVKKHVEAEFNAESMAIRCSLNPKHNMYGIEPHEIIKLWELKGQRSAMYGTQIHQHVEDFINTENWSWIGNTEEQRTVIDQFISVMSELETEEYPFKYGHLQAEDVHHMPVRSSQKINGKYITSVTINRMSPEETYLQLFRNDTTVKSIPKEILSNINVNKTENIKDLLKRFLIDVGVAGSVDIKWYNKDFTKYKIFDIKTDNEITTQSYNGKKFLKKPCNKLQECKLNTYGLQIYMYAIIGSKMKNTDAVFDDGAIIHWNKKHQTFTHIPLNDYTLYAKALLASYFDLI